MNKFDRSYSDSIPRGVANYAENLKYRKEVFLRCREDLEFRQEVWNACARDVLFWINTFVWTYDPRQDSPVVPFTTWEFQDDCFNALDKSLGRNDSLIEKSRDMGASWLVLTLFAHRFLFRPMQSFLMVSRKEEYVDKTGDMKGLFQKIDFIVDYLPPWMIPSIERNKLHMRNRFNGSSIDGESTNGDVGRGDRRTAILLDEFASVENDYEVESATRDVTKCRIYNSTPKGVATAFYEKRQKMSKEAPERLLRMHWSRHPEKAAGLYRFTKGEELAILDEEYEFPEGYHFVKDGKLRSVWYDEQCLRASNEQEVAQEVDIDYKKSGWQFFQQDILDEIIAKHAKAPVWRGDITFDESFREVNLIINSDGPLMLWRELDINKKIVGHPTLVFGADIATGKGGASNSVLIGYDSFTRQKVLEWKGNTLSPERFADLVTAIGSQFATEFQQHSLLCFEANGPGGQFSKQIVINGYSNLYHRKNELAVDDKESKALIGWWSSRETKKVLLGQYATALMDDFAINCSEFALNECGEYIVDPKGDIVHSRSMGNSDPTIVGDNHGDTVIADALAIHLLKSMTVVNNESSTRTLGEVPFGSLAWRQAKAREHELNKDGIWNNR